MNFLDVDSLSRILSEHYAKSIRVQRVQIDGDERNDGWTAQLLTVAVEYRETDASATDTKRQTFFAKIPHSSVKGAIFQKLGLYANEAYAYDVILPKINALTTEPFAPLHYYTGEQNALLLQNLVESGYEIRPDEPFGFDFETCLLCFETLAAFHAYSRVVDAAHPELRDRFEFIIGERRCVEFLLDESVPIMRRVLRRTDDSPEAVWSRELDAIDKRMRDNMGAENEIDFEIKTYCRGDFKGPNILFKKDPSAGGKTILKFVDFQTMRWNAPVHDIIYFVMNSMSLDGYVSHFDKLLDAYSTVFNDIQLRHFGTINNDRYDANKMKNDLKRLPLFTFHAFASMVANRHSQAKKRLLVDENCADEFLLEIIPRWFEFLRKNDWHL